MPLNKAVQGLPDLLGLYRGGQVALEANPWATPTYDLLPFLVPVEWAYNTGTAGAAPWSVRVTVPEGEMWLVNLITGQAALPAANDIANCYAYWNPGTAGGAYIEYPLQTEATRQGNALSGFANTAIAYAKFDNHLIATAGNDLGVYISNQNTLGNITMNIAVCFHRIRV